MDIQLPKLYPWQEDLIKLARSNYESGKFFYVKSIRQRTGKTFTLMNLIICCAFDKPGCKSVFIEPFNSQCEKVFNDLVRACKDIIKSSNKTSKEIVFNNNSLVYLRSAEAGDSIRGLTVTGICCIDEGCYIKRDFIESCLPIVSKFNALTIFASSPDKASGWFYENYIKPDNRVVSINWSKYVNEVYTQEELDYYKRIYSKRRFTTEILGEFTQTDGSVFTNLEGCIDEPKLGYNLYFGIDWGSGLNKDNTVVSCINSNGNMIFIKYFNDKTPIEQIDYIAKLINDYKPIKVTVETNSIGNIYLNLLQNKTKIKINKFTTSNKTKNQIIEKLQVALENKDITLIRDEELLLELRVYQEESIKTGKTYNAPQGYKDDCVMATAICWDSFHSNKGIYNIC